MSEHIRCWLFGRNETVARWGAARPFNTEQIANDGQLSEMLDNLPPTQSVLIVLLDPFQEEKELCLTQLETSPNVHRVLVTYDGLSEDLFSQEKFIHLSVSRVVIQIMYDLIYLYCQVATHYVESENIELADIIQKKIQLNFAWTLLESKFEIPNILLVPLNTEKTNLRSAQAEILTLCSETLGGSNIVVKTLQDFTDLNDDEQVHLEQRLIVNKINEAVRRTVIGDFGPTIILFLVGNLQKSFDRHCLSLLKDVIRKAENLALGNQCFVRLITNSSVDHSQANVWIDQNIPANTIGLSRSQIISISSLKEKQEFTDALPRSTVKFNERSHNASMAYQSHMVVLMQNQDDTSESGNQINAPNEIDPNPHPFDWNINRDIAFDQDNQ